MQSYAAVASTIFSAIAIFFAWYQFRKSQYRIDQVTDWANRSIDVLQRLFVLVSDKGGIFSEEAKRAAIADIYVESSILVEKGRLFFKNELRGRRADDRPPAYRGKRPRILDPLVVAHEICRDWLHADPPRREQLARLAFDNARQFVSLAQKEAGRSKFMSADSGEGGPGVSLERLLAELPVKSPHAGG